MTSPEPVTPPPTPSERASLDAARERAIRVLTDRFADDTLTVEEFEARLDRMYQARSTAELEAVTSDIGRALTAPAAAAAARPVPLGTRSGYPHYPDERPPLRRVLALMSETRQTGRFVVARRIEVRAIMSDYVLDLRDAAIPAGFCEVDLVAVMANVRVLVPPGVIVEGHVTAVMAATSNDAEDDGRLPANATRIRLTGMAFMAEVRVRVAPAGPSYKEAWRLGRGGV